MPHRQVPLPQLFAREVSQATQACPLLPHCETVREVTQSVPSQQPAAQLVLSQTHWLLMQREPGPHGGPKPQAHSPVSQLSAVPAAHAMHVAPKLPHALVETAVTQVLP